MPGIQSRTSDIFFLYEMMSSEQLQALIIRLKPDRTGKEVSLTVLIFYSPASLHFTHLNFASLPPEGEFGSSDRILPASQVEKRPEFVENCLRGAAHAFAGHLTPRRALRPEAAALSGWLPPNRICPGSARPPGPSVIAVPINGGAPNRDPPQHPSVLTRLFVNVQRPHKAPLCPIAP